MRLWCRCQKHFCRCAAAATTGGSVVTFCRCAGMLFTSGSCRAGGRAVSPSAAPRSSTVCQRYSWLHPVGDRLQHTEQGGKLKWNKHSERYIQMCGQSVSPPAGGVLLLNQIQEQSKVVRLLMSNLFFFTSAHRLPSSVGLQTSDQISFDSLKTK